MPRSIDDILKDDPKFRRFLEINLEILSNISKIGYGEIEHAPIKEGKILWKRQEIRISGSE
jgi:hypothetical protein